MNEVEYERMQESAATGACIETALRNHHTEHEADSCDNGSVGCPDCPFTARGRFFAACRDYDLTYSFSDDSRAYWSGEAQRRKLLELAQALPYTEARDIFNAQVDTKIVADSRHLFYWPEASPWLGR